MRSNAVHRDESGKVCTKCGVYRLWSEFPRDKSTLDGYTYGCKECRRQVSDKWRVTHPEKARAATNIWVAANKERVQESARAFAAAKRAGLGKAGWSAVVEAWNKYNPEKLMAQRKRHYANNRERLRHKQAADRAARPEAHKAYDAAKRAKRKNGYCPWANKEAIQAIYDWAKYLSETTGIEHHVDHDIPLVHPLVQGLHVEHNLKVMTADGNLAKGNKFRLG